MGESPLLLALGIYRPWFQLFSPHSVGASLSQRSLTNKGIHPTWMDIHKAANMMGNQPLDIGNSGDDHQESWIQRFELLISRDGTLRSPVSPYLQL
ncbi:hypothetical protein BDV26DRAFT_263756 [Aspergillus bertholletiae]|uniref:Uncharacterized protein n=1 Tax=Aspergillus bertholletiae TaxID=1226010 RepID=A0A5N7B5U3_9EURO|nr:hypothetical protein BDV26DRAFT_263756 [Aspergillus bertholletiae]